MIEQFLPEIPRIITAFAEWSACLVYILPLKKRFSRQATAGILIFACGFQYALQSLVSEFNLSFWILGMFLNVIFMFSYIYLSSAVKLKEALYWCAVSFVTAEFLASLEWQISCFLLKENVSHNDWRLILICVLVFGMVLGGIYFLEHQVRGIGKKIGTNQSLTAVILAVIAFTMSNIYFLNSQWNSTVIQQWSVYYIRTLIDFCVICILYLQQQILLEQDYRNELSSINSVLNLHYKQYLDFKESSDYISRQCHDLKHQIAELRTACTREEREAYLTEMEAAITSYDGQNVTGNAVLDAVLTRKKMYCLQHEIDFSISADGRVMSFLSVRDICTIMGNILDNAIEHVSGFDEREERQIQGEIYQKNAFLMIRLENYYYGQLCMDDSLPKTTKSDRQRHGYGLKSVKYTVEKYGGSMTLKTEGNWFVVRILIPLEVDSKGEIPV